MILKNQSAQSLNDLREWVLSHKQNEGVVKVLWRLLKSSVQSKSQKTTESLWNLLLTFPAKEFRPSQIVIERLERQAYSELIPEIPLLLAMIESAQHFREKNQCLPSSFPDLFRDRVDQMIFERDLRGVECPRNYVKASVILKRLAVGSQLDLLLDSGQPIENVPMRLRGDGYKILDRIKEEDHWKLMVKKPQDP